MAINRRTFMATGLGGTLAALGAGAQGEGAGAAEAPATPVRLGIIGVGGPGTPVGSGRGNYLMRVLMTLPGVSIAAICDINQQNLDYAIAAVKEGTGATPAGYSAGETDYLNLLKRDDVDAVVIATPSQLHARMAIDAMKAGKHAASEVPAGYALDELWELVRTKEATGKRYIMLENYIYWKENLQIQHMVDQGIFGEPYLGESAYIQDVRWLYFNADGSLTWRGEWNTQYVGNMYSTHALGPVSKWFGINDGDRFVRSVSMMTEPRMVRQYAIEKFGADSAPAKLDYILGDYVTTELRTEKGRVIRNDFDCSSPRPVEPRYLLQGTQGIYSSMKDKSLFLSGKHNDYVPLTEFPEHQHPYWVRYGEEAKQLGHGGGDYFLLKDFVAMVREDREPWIDVYDAATWSAVYHCSHESIMNNSAPVEFPDFTEGKYKRAGWRKDHMRPA